MLQAALRNALGSETSPYLLQHRDNPVHWQPWGPAALAHAKSLNRPILLSVGYAACHWCHVMAHESFEDAEIAAVMNSLFVNIKVDREERPDIDAIYQTALALIGEPGGWPLTMFLTPDGEPYYGGTYYPPEPRFGRPAFRQVLEILARLYANEPEKIQRNTHAIRTALARTSATSPGPLPSPAALDTAADRILDTTDPEYGGFGTAPKFPHTPALETLWRTFLRTNKAPYRAAVIGSLTAMCQGGIYDHLGGGFARYSTDAQWLVPHFEKMLYDNAALLDLLATVWADTRNPLFRARAEETVAWLLRDMRVEPKSKGPCAFSASLDADSEGEEGRYYVWTATEIDSVLGSDSALFKRTYGVTAAGNWEGRNILHRADAAFDPGNPGEIRLAAARERLLAIRSRRAPPGLDDKVLVDWNGLLVTALARAASLFARPDWLVAARDAFAFIANPVAFPDWRLFHSYRAGQARHAGTLDDYVAMARAALALFESTGLAFYLDAAKGWIATLDRHFWDPEAGAYFFTADDAEALIHRTRTAADAATPNGNGQAVEALARLYYQTGNESYRIRAEAIITAFAKPMIDHPFAFATLHNAARLLSDAVQVVIAGDPDAENTRRLVQAVWNSWHPALIVTPIGQGHDFPPTHPAAGKSLLDGRAAVYVCAGQRCSLPVQDPTQLARLLRTAAPETP
ncbi:MAG: thioredoxin domain-containing protein [Alphaproteobacteria bacterium]